jgi:cytochrome c-type biogenesis protein
MLLLTGALIAGILTTLAPCVLPLLPVIVGGSISQSGKKSINRALLISASLGFSVIVFTLLLKATTYFIDIPNSFWQWISGLILISLGLFAAKPLLWEQVSMTLSLQSRSTPLLSKARERDGKVGAVLTGAALGPVFSSCSPLYAYVIVTVLPASFAQGLALLFAYALGLCGTLLLVALLGQRLIKSAGWAVNPESIFRRGLGWIFIIVGIAIIAGWDKDIQTWVVENSPIRPWEIDSSFIP